eukprot:6209641-Pleurochrysis_carterae.AAC.1
MRQVVSTPCAAAASSSPSTHRERRASSHRRYPACQRSALDTSARAWFTNSHVVPDSAVRR